jgi:hypothetical protein
MASTKLTRTPSSAGNRKTYTISMWIKRSELSSSNKTVLDSNFNGGASENRIYLNNNSLEYYDYASSAYQFRYITNRLLRDVSAWYHIVIAVDTTQATAANRVKIYINGVQETSFSTTINPSQNLDTQFNTANLTQFGAANTGVNFFDGLMSHINFIDGTAYDATAFGEYDANGVWTIKTSPSVTYGTNGFFILKDGNSVTDQSGNTNNFTVAGGTLTKTEDSPSNVFATFNNLYKSNETLSYGNTRSVLPIPDQFGGVSTIGVSSGKWYAEFKPNIAGSNFYGCGIIGNVSFSSNNNVAAGRNNSIGYRSGDGQKGVDNTFSSYGDTYTTNDIIGIALDLDSATNTITFYKNNVSQGTINITVPNPDGVWHFCACSMATGGSSDWSANFGNGYFGTTAVASAGTNASGIGIFEYDVPTGFTALSTKGLNL